ncbi:hypothetical protein FKM82_030743 [Ascaphus truei]
MAGPRDPERVRGRKAQMRRRRRRLVRERSQSHTMPGATAPILASHRTSARDTALRTRGCPAGDSVTVLVFSRLLLPPVHPIPPARGHTPRGRAR